MDIYTVRPLAQWPYPQSVARERKRSPFRATLTATHRLLAAELQHLQAKNVVLQIDVPDRMIRVDGALRSDARADTPRLILSFDSRFGPLSYPCDRFEEWQDNLRAIALSLEHLRAVDRYGVTKRGEQYSGWTALPPAAAAVPVEQTKAEALRELHKMHAKYLIVASLKKEKVSAGEVAKLPDLLRWLEKRTHPDMGGQVEDFKRLQELRGVLLK